MSVTERLDENKYLECLPVGLKSQLVVTYNIWNICIVSLTRVREEDSRWVGDTESRSRRRRHSEKKEIKTSGTGNERDSGTTELSGGEWKPGISKRFTRVHFHKTRMARLRREGPPVTGGGFGWKVFSLFFPLMSLRYTSTVFRLFGSLGWSREVCSLPGKPLVWRLRL